jgi:hypothetical protein
VHELFSHLLARVGSGTQPDMYGFRGQRNFFRDKNTKCADNFWPDL